MCHANFNFGGLFLEPSSHAWSPTEFSTLAAMDLTSPSWLVFSGWGGGGGSNCHLI